MDDIRADGYSPTIRKRALSRKLVELRGHGCLVRAGDYQRDRKERCRNDSTQAFTPQ